MTAVNESTDASVTSVVDEREVLKARADTLGIVYAQNIPTDKLRDLVNKKISGGVGSTMDAVEESADEIARKEALRLIRVNITVNCPTMQQREGEIYTVSNRLVNVRKLVLFNTPEGYHIPNIIYEHLLNCEFTQTYLEPRRGGGEPIRRTRKARMYNIEVLPPLTPEQLKQMATAQLSKEML